MLRVSRRTLQLKATSWWSRARVAPSTPQAPAPLLLKPPPARSGSAQSAVRMRPRVHSLLRRVRTRYHRRCACCRPGCRSTPAPACRRRTRPHTHRRGARKEIGAAGRTKQAARGTAAERSAHVGTLAVLHEHQANHDQRGEELDAKHEVQPDLHIGFLSKKSQPAARQMATKSAAFNDAPPIRPPSMSGCAKSVAALSGLTLPP